MSHVVHVISEWALVTISGLAVIRTLYKYSRLVLITAGYHIYLNSYVFLRRRCSFTSRKLDRLFWEIHIFVSSAAIWLNLCFWSFIPPLLVLVPKDSNVALYAQVCWHCCMLYMPLFSLFLYSKRLAKAALNASRVRVASYIPSATTLPLQY